VVRTNIKRRGSNTSGPWGKEIENEKEAHWRSRMNPRCGRKKRGGGRERGEGEKKKKDRNWLSRLGGKICGKNYLRRQKRGKTKMLRLDTGKQRNHQL